MKAESIATLNKSISRNYKKVRSYSISMMKIIEDQVKEGIVKITPQDSRGHPVIRENAENIKTRIAYDGSVKGSNSTISSNNCLETQPSL